MAQYNFWGVPAQVDQAATKNWYAHAQPWDCTCGHCRNFSALAQTQMLPEPVREILSKIGIPPEKATYVCQICPQDEGHLYQFSYRVAGCILDEGAIPLSQSWGEVRCRHESYPYGAPGFPTPHFDLEFWLTLPWVLEEAP